MGRKRAIYRDGEGRKREGTFLEVGVKSSLSDILGVTCLLDVRVEVCTASG